MQSYMQT